MDASFTLGVSDLHIPAIVMDCGTCLSRVGYSTDLRPKFVEPTVVASEKPNRNEGTSSSDKSKTLKKLCGKEALSPPENFYRKYPIEFGLITNYDSMEAMWNHLLLETLKAKPEEFPMVYLEEPLLPVATREKTAQIMFETFDVPALCLLKSSEAQLMAHGNRRTGLVVDAGGGIFSVASVVEGYVPRMAVPKVEECGRDITFHLLKLLRDNGKLEYSRAHETAANTMKEEMCYVAYDFEEEQDTFSCQQERQFTLPDGSSITVAKERFLCPEVIFQPILKSQEMPGLHEIMFNSLRYGLRDEELQKELLANVVLCGGCAPFPGFVSRLEKELQKLAGHGAKVHVVASLDQHSAFKGAAMLARREDFGCRMLTKDFYDEYGPHGIVRHCF